MKILVTGCAGFIGWRVSTLLAREGHTVIGLDNLNDAYDVRLKHWRLKQLASCENFCFQHGDVSEKSGLQSIVSNTGLSGPLDGIINLAARAGVRASVEDPWTYYHTNLIGTLNLLDICREQGIGKLVLSSTSSAYGNGEVPFREESPADRPVSPYAASKKAAEELCYTYHALHGLDITVLRYFTVYGPGGRPDMSVFRFIKWISEGQPLLVYGDGTQERDFTFVDDIARGTIAALKPLGYQIINLGNDRPVALNHMIETVEKLLGKKARMEFQPMHPADVRATWADISKARELLNWEPQVTLEEGLKRSVAWYEENHTWVKSLKT